MTTDDVILVIDDDPAIVDALRMLLEIEGFSSKGYSGGAAFETIAEIRPRLILLDVWLAGQDGRKLCSRIKSDPKLQDTAVVLISAGGDLTTSATLAGADGFIEKPFDMEVVVSTVKQILSS